MKYMQLAGYEGHILPQESVTFADFESGLKCPPLRREGGLKVASKGKYQGRKFWGRWGHLK
jgi:hypothetical protein